MKNPVKRTYIKSGIWHLGGREKQKGGFLPVLVSLDKPLLISTDDAVGEEILKGLRSKIFGRGKRRSKRRRSRIRRLSKKRLQLPHGRVFFAKYLRVGRDTRTTRMCKDKKNLC